VDPKTAVLAFLAGRSPAAYTEAVIARHVISSGRLSSPPASVHGNLEWMASDSGGRLVESRYDGTQGDLVWWATAAGCARWAQDGRPYIP